MIPHVFFSFLGVFAIGLCAVAILTHDWDLTLLGLIVALISLCDPQNPPAPWQVAAAIPFTALAFIGWLLNLNPANARHAAHKRFADLASEDDARRFAESLPEVDWNFSQPDKVPSETNRIIGACVRALKNGRFSANSARPANSDTPEPKQK